MSLVAACASRTILAPTMPDAGADVAGGSCGGAGGGAGVRVRLNLGQFFTDERARAYMWAPRGQRVRWLARRVARVFALPGALALASRGHVLPAAEPLLLLERDDPVEVIRVSNAAAVYDNASDSSASDVASAAAAPHDEPDELRLLKRRALRLLDERCAQHAPSPLPSVASSPAHTPPPAPAKRARRRRRRRAPAAAETLEALEGVVRSGAGARPPRLVRALSPAAPHGGSLL